MGSVREISDHAVPISTARAPSNHPLSLFPFSAFLNSSCGVRLRLMSYAFAYWFVHDCHPCLVCMLFVFLCVCVYTRADGRCLVGGDDIGLR